MRRVILLALLALALPTAALANSFFFRTGHFESGIIAPPSLTSPLLRVSISGADFTINLITSTLTGNCGVFGGMCTFSNGIVNVFPAGSTRPEFTDRLRDGKVFRGTNFERVVTITAQLLPKTGVASGLVVFNPVFFNSAGHVIHPPEPQFGQPAAFVRVNTTPVPEPGTLGLLGTGLIGLAGIARRKLKLRKVNPDLARY